MSLMNSDDVENLIKGTVGYFVVILLMLAISYPASWLWNTALVPAVTILQPVSHSTMFLIMVFYNIIKFINDLN